MNLMNLIGRFKMPFPQVDEFDRLNSYLREVKLGGESLKGELNTFVWENEEETKKEHFFTILEDMYPLMTRDLFNEMPFHESTWDIFKEDVESIYGLDQKWPWPWPEDKSFFATLEEALNKVVKAQESQIYISPLDGKFQALELDDVSKMKLYSFYNTNLRRLVCFKVGKFSIEKFPTNEDEEEEDCGNGDDST